MLETSDLARFIENHHVLANILELEVPTPTVEDAANAVGTSVEQIVKSLLFLVDGRPVVLITCGTGRVDRRPIAAHFGVGRKRVKLAEAASVLEITGYPIGAMPPFGLSQPLPTLMDRRVLEHEVVYAGGGALNTLIRVSPDEIVRVTGAIEMDFDALSSS
jgi:prolyl-tRNA editing enzyme YbaK/EbsC (Cys-tRNA(Pro) deacylase)